MLERNANLRCFGKRDLAKVSNTVSEPVFWELIGRTWTAPIRVEPHDPLHSKVTVAMELAPAHKGAIVNALSHLSTVEPVDGAFLIPNDLLEKWAVPSKCAIAEEIFEWRREIAVIHFPKDKGVDEMLDAFCAKGIFTNRAVASVFYSQLCSHMLEWLIAKQKPVNLFFAEILPLMFRANWKETIFGKQWLSESDKLPDDEIFAGMDLTALEAGEKASAKWRSAWLLEILPTTMFDRYVAAIELLQRKKQRLRYWLRVEEIMKGQVHHAKRVYRRYLAQIRKKMLAVPAGIFRRTSEHYQWHQGKRARRSGAIVYVVPAYLNSEPSEEGYEGALAETDEPLPAMPAVPPSDIGVRPHDGSHRTPGGAAGQSAPLGTEDQGQDLAQPADGHT